MSRKPFKLPGKKFVQGPAYPTDPDVTTIWYPNTGILADAAWAGKQQKESDRSIVPVLHQRGYFNTARGYFDAGHPGQPDDSAYVVPNSSALSYLEPTRYWGKANTLVTWPRTVMFDEVGRYNRFYNNATAQALCKDNGILLVYYNSTVSFRGALIAGSHIGDPPVWILRTFRAYVGFLKFVPWTSNAIVTDGSLVVLIPTIDAATFIGGESLILLAPATTGACQRFGTILAATLANDLLYASSVPARFDRLLVRVVDEFFGDAAIDNAIASTVGQMAGAGFPIQFDGAILDTAALLAADIAAVKSFFHLP